MEDRRAPAKFELENNVPHEFGTALGEYKGLCLADDWSLRKIRRRLASEAVIHEKHSMLQPFIKIVTIFMYIISGHGASRLPSQGNALSQRAAALALD